MFYCFCLRKGADRTADKWERSLAVAVLLTTKVMKTKTLAEFGQN